MALKRIFEFLSGGKTSKLILDEEVSYTFNSKVDENSKTAELFSGFIISERYETGKSFNGEQLLPVLRTEEGQSVVSLPFLIVKPFPGAREAVIKQMKNYPIQLRRKYVVDSDEIPADIKKKGASYDPLLYEFMTQNVLDVFELAASIQSLDTVAYAHPDFIVPYEEASPPENYVSSQWYLYENVTYNGHPYLGINIEAARDLIATNSALIAHNTSPTIAIIDDGLHPHDDYNENITSLSMNFTAPLPNGNVQPALRDRHGTAILGVIAATIGNNVGINGITNRVNIMPLKVTLNRGTRIYNFQKAIRFAAKYRAHVINISLNPVGLQFDAVNAAIKDAWEMGTTVVCSAGNYTQQRPHRYIQYPANLNEVITVGACDFRGEWIGFRSNVHTTNNRRFGSCYAKNGQRKPDCCAPGTHIITLAPNQQFRIGHDYFRGTSAATAVVSGVVGIMKLINPSLGPEGIRRIINNTCDPLNVQPDRNENLPKSNYIGHGCINAYRAIQQAFQTV